MTISLVQHQGLCLGLLQEIPELPALSFQGEVNCVNSLSGINLSTPQGLLDYQSKLSSITE